MQVPAARPLSAVSLIILENLDAVGVSFNNGFLRFLALKTGLRLVLVSVRFCILAQSCGGGDDDFGNFSISAAAKQALVL